MTSIASLSLAFGFIDFCGSHRFSPLSTLTSLTSLTFRARYSEVSLILSAIPKDRLSTLKISLPDDSLIPCYQWIECPVLTSLSISARNWHCLNAILLRLPTLPALVSCALQSDSGLSLRYITRAWAPLLRKLSITFDIHGNFPISSIMPEIEVLEITSFVDRTTTGPIQITNFVGVLISALSASLRVLMIDACPFPSFQVIRFPKTLISFPHLITFSLRGLYFYMEERLLRALSFGNSPNFRHLIISPVSYLVFTRSTLGLLPISQPVYMIIGASDDYVDDLMVYDAKLVLKHLETWFHDNGAPLLVIIPPTSPSAPA